MCVITTTASRRLFRCSWVLLLLASLAGCGGGGEGDNSDSGGAQLRPDFVVSGTVSAPNATLAFRVQPGLPDRIAQFVMPAAHARLNGTRPVPDGTLVNLLRIDRRGNRREALASTRTLAGKYSFNLAQLGLMPTNNLIVQAVNKSTGSRLRAFVTHGLVDIDSISEASVRSVLDKLEISKRTLQNFTPNELARVTAAIDLVARVSGLRSGRNIETTVAEIEAAAVSDTTLQNFISAAAQAGETDAGPGDIGNYFPFDQGAKWKYVTITVEPDLTFGPTSKYLTITGKRRVSGKNTTVFKQNPNDQDLLVKEPGRIADWSDVAAGIVNKPITLVSFPPVVGATIPQLQEARLNNIDIDGDRRPDLATGTSSASVVGFDFVEAYFGRAFHDALMLETTTQIAFTSSRTGERGKLKSVTLDWYGRGAGLIRKQASVEGNLGSRAVARTTTDTLVSVSGLDIPPNDPRLPWVAEINLKTREIVYEPVSNRIYASVPVGRDKGVGYIAIINPYSGRIEQRVPIGAKPDQLALSADGSLLYVGLNDERAIRLFNTRTRKPGVQFSLENDSSGRPRFARDIEVSPLDASIIAVVLPEGVAIFDDGERLPNNTSPNYSYNPSVEFSSSGNELYSFGDNLNGNVNVFTIDETGLVQSSTILNALIPTAKGWGDYEVSEGFIYGAAGELIDPASKTRLGVLDVGYYPDQVAPDGSNNRVYFTSDFERQLDLQAFSSRTFHLTGALAVPDSYEITPAHSLVFVGDRRIAVAISSSIYLINTADIR